MNYKENRSENYEVNNVKRSRTNNIKKLPQPIKPSFEVVMHWLKEDLKIKQEKDVFNLFNNNQIDKGTNIIDLTKDEYEMLTKSDKDVKLLGTLCMFYHNKNRILNARNQLSNISIENYNEINKKLSTKHINYKPSQYFALKDKLAHQNIKYQYNKEINKELQEILNDRVKRIIHLKEKKEVILNKVRQIKSKLMIKEKVLNTLNYKDVHPIHNIDNIISSIKYNGSVDFDLTKSKYDNIFELINNSLLNNQPKNEDIIDNIVDLVISTKNQIILKIIKDKCNQIKEKVQSEYWKIKVQQNNKSISDEDHMDFNKYFQLFKQRVLQDQIKLKNIIEYSNLLNDKIKLLTNTVEGEEDKKLILLYLNNKIYSNFKYPEIDKVYTAPVTIDMKIMDQKVLAKELNLIKENMEDSKTKIINYFKLSKEKNEEIKMKYINGNKMFEDIKIQLVNKIENVKQNNMRFEKSLKKLEQTDYLANIDTFISDSVDLPYDILSSLKPIEHFKNQDNILQSIQQTININNQRQQQNEQIKEYFKDLNFDIQKYLSKWKEANLEDKNVLNSLKCFIQFVNNSDRNKSHLLDEFTNKLNHLDQNVIGDAKVLSKELNQLLIEGKGVKDMLDKI